jgi:hypothetical protein
MGGRGDIGRGAVRPHDPAVLRLDSGGIDYHQLLDKPLDVTVTLEDPSGASGSATAHMNIDPKIVCPQGTTNCN